MNKNLGDLYWEQLSMWDFSHKEHIDVHIQFHYELMIVTEAINDTRIKIRNVRVDELTKDQIDKLIPEKGHNWSRVMGNNLNLVNNSE